MLHLYSMLYFAHRPGYRSGLKGDIGSSTIWPVFKLKYHIANFACLAAIRMKSLLKSL